MSSLIFLVVAVVFAAFSYRLTRPLGWWWFRRRHQHDPDALAFADRHWPHEPPGRPSETWNPEHIRTIKSKNKEE